MTGIARSRLNYDEGQRARTHARLELVTGIARSRLNYDANLAIQSSVERRW